MLSGRRLDLLDPSPLDIEVEDIAHGLARVARWNGQTVGEHAFSVAQHSVVVEEICAHIQPGLEPKWRLAALLHDAAEYVIGDMISPFKAALGYDYKSFEARLETGDQHPLQSAAGDANRDQGADQTGRPRVCLFRGGPTGRVHSRRSRELLRQTAQGLQPDHRTARPLSSPEHAICSAFIHVERSHGRRAACPRL